MASPATIAKREPEMDPVIVSERITLLERLTFPGSQVVIVDAEQPLADVIGRIKQEIWQQI